MSFVYKQKDGNENPGRLHGARTEGRGLGARPIQGIMNMWWDTVLVDLELSAYETGGIPIPQNALGFTHIYDMMVMAGPDPFNKGDAAPPDGLTFQLDSSNPRVPLLKISNASGELAGQTVQASGVQVWLCFGGIK